MQSKVDVVNDYNVILLHNIYKPDDWIAMNDLFTMKTDVIQWVWYHAVECIVETEKISLSRKNTFIW